jgi:FMN-dependent NADH-azoreductase
MKNTKLLKINASSRYQDSVTRQLTETVSNSIINKYDAEVINRDLAQGLPFIDEQWVNANFTPKESRTAAQLDQLSFSDHLVSELQQAEHIVIGVPIYNFSIPAVLKAWVDLIARARLTFQYTETGVEGLLKNKKVYLVMASGGVPIGSDLDFASSYLTHVLGFVGINDVTIIDASKVDIKSFDLNTFSQ